MMDETEEKTPLMNSDSENGYSSTAEQLLKSPINSELTSSRSTPISVPDIKYDPEKKPSAGTRSSSQHSTTNLQSLMHLIKANVGSGIMAMPLAISNAGIVVGTVGILVMGLIATHCMHLLVTCSHYLCEKEGHAYLDFGQVAEVAFKRGPGSMKKFSKAALIVVNVFLNITQFGFCCVYIVFIARNVQEVVEGYSDWKQIIQVHEVLLVILLIPFVIFFCDLKKLSYASMAANVATVIALIVIFQHIVQHTKPANRFPAFTEWSKVPLFFGSAMYAFEGIGVVLPIENKMKTPEDYRGLSGVLTLGMTTVTVLYTAVGFYGYLRYGLRDKPIRGSITLNLPHTWLYTGVKVIYSMAIFCTYGLQFYVPVNIVWPHITSKLKLNRRAAKIGNYIFKTGVVLITFSIAAAIPYLDKFISLVGSVSCASLALIFPPILHIITFWDEKDRFGPCRWHIYKDVLIAILGILGFITGTYTSFDAIVDCFKNPNKLGCKA